MPSYSPGRGPVFLPAPPFNYVAVHRWSYRDAERGKRGRIENYALDEEIQGSINQDAAACLGELSQSPQGHRIMQTTSGSQKSTMNARRIPIIGN